MGLFDSFMGGSDAGSKINKQSKLLQQQQAYGQNQLNAMFHGGSYGVNPQSAYAPWGQDQSSLTKQPYYTGQGQQYQFDPKSEGFLDFYNRKKAEQAKGSFGDIVKGGLMGNYKALGSGEFDVNDSRKFLGVLPGISGATSASGWEKPRSQGPSEKRMGYWEQKYGNNLTKNGQLYGATQTEKGFTPEFYNQATDAYINYAMPQLLSQYNQTRQGLDSKLSNQGLMGGSAAKTAVNRLDNEATLQKQGIANEALSRSNQLKQNVEQQYASLSGQLQQSTNPGQVMQQALQTASQFSTPSYAGPIGSLFGNYANQYLAGQLGGQYGRLAGTTAGAYGLPRMNNQPSTSFVR